MNKKRKIGFNGRFLTKKLTGIGRYSINLLKELSSLMEEKNCQIVAVTDQEVEVDFPNVRIIVLPELQALKRVNAGLAKSYWEKKQIAKVFQEEGVELIHLPYPSLLPSGLQTPTICTVHDSIPWNNQDYVKASKLGSIYNQQVLKELASVDQILTVSESSKKDLLSLDGWKNQNITVTYNGCDLLKSDSVNTSEILKKYGILDDNYLFYLGGFDARKNVLRTVELFAMITGKVKGLKLVLGGKKILNNNLFGEYNLILERIKAPDLDGKVIFTGEIEESDLSTLYASAKAMINLSKAEGFNLNIVEALKCGTPILASDLPVHQEIVGGAGIAVNWLNLNDNNDFLVEKIVNLLDSTDVYNSSKQAALDYRCPYTWRKNAEQVWKIYQTLLK